MSAAQARLRTLHSAAHYSPTNSTQALTGLTRAFKCAVDASAPDSQLTGNVSDLFALLKETNRILSLRPSSGLITSARSTGATTSFTALVPASGEKDAHPASTVTSTAGRMSVFARPWAGAASLIAAPLGSARGQRWAWRPARASPRPAETTQRLPLPSGTGSPVPERGDQQPL